MFMLCTCAWRFVCACVCVFVDERVDSCVRVCVDRELVGGEIAKVGVTLSSG